MIVRRDVRRRIGRTVEVLGQILLVHPGVAYSLTRDRPEKGIKAAGIYLYLDDDGYDTSFPSAEIRQVPAETERAGVGSRW
jgi:hypothetical protein